MQSYAFNRMNCIVTHCTCQEYYDQGAGLTHENLIDDGKHQTLRKPCISRKRPQGQTKLDFAHFKSKGSGWVIKGQDGSGKGEKVNPFVPKMPQIALIYD